MHIYSIFKNVNTIVFILKATFSWMFVHCHFVALNLNAGRSGYLDNFKIFSMLTLTFNCGFPCDLGLEKLRKMPWCNYILIKLPDFPFIVVWKMPWCNYILIKLPDFPFIVVWIFTLFCPLRGHIYQRYMSGNLACSEPTAILRESNFAEGYN